MNTNQNGEGTAASILPTSKRALLVALRNLVNENEYLRQRVAHLTPRAAAFDLLLHTHLGSGSGHVEVGTGRDYYAEDMIAALQAEVTTEEEAERVKHAEKAKAAKTKTRKPRKPKAEEPAPAKPATDESAGEGDKQGEGTTEQSNVEQLPEGGSRRRRGFFGADPTQQ